MLARNRFLDVLPRSGICRGIRVKCSDFCMQLTWTHLITVTWIADVVKEVSNTLDQERPASPAYPWRPVPMIALHLDSDPKVKDSTDHYSKCEYYYLVDKGNHK